MRFAFLYTARQWFERLDMFAQLLSRMMLDRRRNTEEISAVYAMHLGQIVGPNCFKASGLPDLPKSAVPVKLNMKQAL